MAKIRTIELWVKDPFASDITDNCSPNLPLVQVGSVLSSPQFPMWGPSGEYLRGGLTDETADGHWRELFAKAAGEFHHDVVLAIGGCL